MESLKQKVTVIIFSSLTVMFLSSFMSCGNKTKAKNDGKKVAKMGIVEKQKANVARLGSFIGFFSPDDESYWAQDEAKRQLAQVTGHDADFYQDQAHIASAWSYVFYGMGYVPMCNHFTSPANLSNLSANIVRLDSTHTYTAEELVDLQIKAMKAQAYYHYAQGVADYAQMKEAIEETENNGKGMSARIRLIGNQTLFFKLLATEIGSMGNITEKEQSEIKQAADSVDSSVAAVVGMGDKVDEAAFRKHIVKAMTANNVVATIFIDRIAKAVERQKSQK